MTSTDHPATVHVKSYDRRKPDDPYVALRRLKHAQLAVEIMEREIENIVRKECEEGLGNGT